MNLQQILEASFHFHALAYVSLTQKCPIECAHCFVDSSPRRKEHISPAEFTNWVSGIVHSNRIRAVLFSGGEPFSNPGALRAGLDACMAARKASIVGTSAYWASSAERAKKHLSRYPHIDTLWISTDGYHEEFVPLSYLRHAVDAADSCGTRIAFQIVEDDPDRSRFVDRFFEIVDPFRERASQVFFTPLGKQGRASDVEQSIELCFESTAVQDVVCPWLGAPWIHEDGVVCACPNLGVHQIPNHPLQLGSLRNASFEIISDKASNDPLLQALRVLGPREVAAAIGFGELIAPTGQSASPTICDLCHAIAQSPCRVESARSHFSSPHWRRRLQVAELLAYGEITFGVVKQTAKMSS